jgi:Plexin repeat
MNRNLAAVVLACTVGVALAACGDDNAETAYAYGAGPSGGTYGGCSSYTTCGSCTPVDGCGWCFNATSGVCTTDPDSCQLADASEFTWTWDPSGCPGIDASVASIDAGSTATPEAGPSASDASDASDASSAVLGDALVPFEASGAQ